MWRHLTHPNIVPLLGITLEPLQLISTWIPGGELKVYIIGNPDTDRLALVGVPPPLASSNYAYTLSSYAVSLMASITSISATLSTVISKGYVIIINSKPIPQLCHTWTAEYSRG